MRHAYTIMCYGGSEHQSIYENPKYNLYPSLTYKTGSFSNTKRTKELACRACGQRV